VLVVGQPRGGTSAVAGVLDALGVYMGPPEELRNGGSFESFVFCHGDDAARLAEIDRCNSSYDVWGWKQPFGVHALQLVPRTVRNLFCIFVTRDPWATAEAYCRHANTTIDVALEAARARGDDVLDLAISTSHPSLVVSFERLKTMRVEFVGAVVRFLALTVTPDQLASAVGRISPVGGYPQMPDTYGMPAAPPPHTTPERWKRGESP
jgi:hypothetical protein